VDEQVEQVDDLVLTQGELLRLPVRMLDDVDQLAQDRLALSLDQWQEAEPCEILAGLATGLYCDQAEVEPRIGYEQLVGS
jgi:hypothetical protein